MLRQIKTSTGLIVIFAATVILFGGAITYYYKMMPTTWDMEVHVSSSVVKKTISADETKDWKTYTSNDYGFSFKYPTDWEYSTSLNATNADNSNYKLLVSFRPNTMKEDFLGSVAVEQKSLDNSIETIKKSFSSNSTFISKTTEKISKYDAVKLSFRNNTDNSILPTQYLLEKNNLIYVISGKGSTGSVKNEQVIAKIIDSFLFNETPNPTTTTTATVSGQSTVSSTITYTNNSYGFSLTLPQSWSSYKVKTTKVEGELDTYYFELPTKDPLHKEASTTADAGYASAFAIGVMNKSDWTGSEDQMRDFGSKVGENSSYVFTASYAQASASDISADVYAAVKAIIESFKLS